MMVTRRTNHSRHKDINDCGVLSVDPTGWEPPSPLVIYIKNYVSLEQTNPMGNFTNTSNWHPHTYQSKYAFLNHLEHYSTGGSTLI